MKKLQEYNVPHSESPSLVITLGDPVKIRSWQIAGIIIYINVLNRILLYNLVTTVA